MDRQVPPHDASEPIAAEHLGKQADSPLLIGIPCSKGRATGPVRLVHSVDDFDAVQPGDILVCRTTDPAWTMLFGTAAAVVTEIGGILSHAAIVAREFGIPAVVSAKGALRILAHHQTIAVDGTTGHVHAVRPAER
ncbi:PEP-utilizing enzyme [Nocardia sp. NPDC050712]|uniref:PEP-utilizing enzyme n=1 Tax=Nocardia sp. NPDC050712 TaxID=3155518 RepID=UPI0033C0255E